MEGLKYFLKSLGWWDLFFVIFIFLLFVYFLNYNFIIIFFNIVIIIFFFIGLILIMYIIIDKIKSNMKWIINMNVIKYKIEGVIIMVIKKDVYDLFLNYVNLNVVKIRKMMGEYIIYYDGVVIGGLYDNRLLVKVIKSV